MADKSDSQQNRDDQIELSAEAAGPAPALPPGSSDGGGESGGLLKRLVAATVGQSRSFLKDEAWETAKRTVGRSSDEAHRQVQRVMTVSRTAQTAALKSSAQAKQVGEQANVLLTSVTEALKAGQVFQATLKSQRSAEAESDEALKAATERTITEEAERSAREMADVDIQQAIDRLEEVKAAQVVLAARDAARKAAAEGASKVAKSAAIAAATSTAKELAGQGKPRAEVEQAARESAHRAAFAAVEAETLPLANEAANKAADQAARAVEKAASAESERRAEAARIRRADRQARQARARKAVGGQRGARAAAVVSEIAASSRRRRRKKKRPPRRLSLTWALGLVAGLALTGVFLYFLHGFQVNRVAQNMLARGREARRAGDLENASRYLSFYVRQVQDDDDALVAYAQVLAERARAKRGDSKLQEDAYRYLGRAAIRRPGDMAIIKDLAEFAYRFGRFADASGYYARLRQEDPDDLDSAIRMGRCLVQEERTRDALAAFDYVRGVDPKRIEAYVELARLYRSPRVDRVDDADLVMDQMVDNNRVSPEAYTARATYRLENKDLDGATHDVTLALETDPDDPSVLIVASRLARQREDLELALDYLEHAADLHPEDDEVRHELAILNITLGKPKEAIVALEKLAETSDQATPLLSLADTHLQQGNLDSVVEVIRQMERKGYSPQIISFYLARIRMARGQWRAGARDLERLLAQVSGHPEFRHAVGLLLGACYGQLQLPDRQQDVYRDIVESNPDMDQARMGYAVSLLQTGKIDEAHAQFEHLKRNMGSDSFLANPAMRSGMFQAMSARIDRLPELQRDWTELEEYIDEMVGIEGIDVTRRTLMEAEVLAKQSRYKEARGLVAARKSEFPKQVDLWVALAKLTAMESGPAAGLEVLAEARTKVTSRLPLHQTQINFAARLDLDEGTALLDDLAEKLHSGKIPKAERNRLWLTLGAGYYRLRDRIQAQKYWKLAAEADPENARIRLTLFELAREMNDKAGLREATDDIKKVLGLQSAEADYCETAMAVWKVQTEGASKRTLGTVRDRLRNAAQIRPSWHAIPRLEGEIAMLEDRVDDAIDAFRRASQLGPLSPVYLGQLVRLLYLQERYAEARDVMSELGTGTMSLTFKRLEAELNFRTGRFDEALTQAAESTVDSKSANDHLWYGQMLAQAGQLDEAEAEIAKALDIESDLPEAWIARVALLVKQEKREEAEKALVEAQTRLPSDRTELVLAHCHFLLGDPGRAEQHFLNAISAEPENLTVIREVARFYLQIGRRAQTQHFLRQIITLGGRDPKQHDEDLVWARRSLARVLATGGDYRQLRQALELIDRNAHGGVPLIEDLRLKATLLAARNDPSSRQRALSCYQSISAASDNKLSVQDRFIQARLFEQSGRWVLVQDQMEVLIGEQSKNVLLRATYIDMLLRNEAAPERIRPHVVALEKLQPDSSLTKKLRIRFLARTGDTTDAVTEALAMLPEPVPNDKLGLFREVAALLEEINQIQAARTLLRQFADRVPGGSVVLADFLARHGTVREALSACERAARERSVLFVLRAAVNILNEQGENCTETDQQRITEWFEQAREEHPDSKTVQSLWAAVLDAREEYDQVVVAYRTFLERTDLLDHERAVVWNNLAFYLAAGDGDPDEAVRLAGQAYDILGPSPEVLDTRGLAYVASANHAKALESLREAVLFEPTGSTYFHLAQAHAGADDLRGAARALRMAQENHQLEETDLPKLERQKYRRLLLQLKPFLDDE